MKISRSWNRETRRRLVRIRMLWLLVAGLAAGAYWAFSPQRPSPQQPAQPEAQSRASIVLAATTSVQDSGLLDRLLPEFERQTGIQVRTVAVGSGKALEPGRLGEADLVLSHSPALEDEFVRDGFAAEKLPFAHNEFIIAGPPAGRRPRRTPSPASPDPGAHFSPAATDPAPMPGSRSSGRRPASSPAARAMRSRSWAWGPPSGWPMTAALTRSWIARPL